MPGPGLNEWMKDEGPDPTTLVVWKEEPGDLWIAAYREDDLEVRQIATHCWRWKVNGPTRGEAFASAPSREEAMLEALKHVGHPAVDHDRGFRRPDLQHYNHTDRHQQLLSARKRFCDELEAESGLSIGAFVSGLESLLEYALVVERTVLEREARPVDEARREIIDEEMRSDAEADAIEEDRREREEVEAP